MKTIAFHDNNLCLRGTTNAMYTYADYNEKILGNKSIILSSINGNMDSLEKFQKRFDKIYLTHFYEYDRICAENKVDYLYITKSGGKSDGLVSNNIPSLIHVVFRSNEPHGHKYVFISDWLAKDQGYEPENYSVPYIVENLPTPQFNLRNKLGIPYNAKVFGCYAGETEFNIKDVHVAIEKTVNERKDIYFIFMNINKFCPHNENIIHLPGSYNLYEKSAFVHACDTMIHARGGGETFGLAVAEFAKENKPIITFSESGERAHIEILGERAIYYRSFDEVYDILNNLDSYIKHDDYFRAYDDYTPEKIMYRFDKNFLR